MINLSLIGLEEIKRNIRVTLTVEESRLGVPLITVTCVGTVPIIRAMLLAPAIIGQALVYICWYEPMLLKVEVCSRLQQTLPVKCISLGFYKILRIKCSICQ